MFLHPLRLPALVRYLPLTLCCVLAVQPFCAQAQGKSPLMTPDRPGLSVILPAQAFPVEADELDAPARDMALETYDEDPLSGLPPEPEPVLDLDWKPGVDTLPPEHRVALTGMFGIGPVVSLKPRADASGWVRQAGSMKYQQDNGSTLVLGQVTDAGGFWGHAPRLGGVQVTRMPNISSRGTLMPGSFGLSAELGMATEDDLSRTGSGGLSVGAPVGRGSMRLGLTQDFTLESQVQSRPDANSVGIGGTMALSDWGLLRLNTTQTNPNAATHTEVLAPSWRSGLGMQVSFDRHQLESTYETVRYNQSAIEQRLGFKHSWSVSPSLKMQFGADRELINGGYSARMQMSVPLDAVVSQWWRN